MIDCFWGFLNLLWSFHLSISSLFYPTSTYYWISLLVFWVSIVSYSRQKNFIVLFLINLKLSVVNLSHYGYNILIFMSRLVSSSKSLTLHNLHQWKKLNLNWRPKQRCLLFLRASFSCFILQGIKINIY